MFTNSCKFFASASYFGVILATLVSAAAAAPVPSIVVSSASYQPAISPESIATIFGSGLASEHVVAALDAEGRLPTELGGTTVEIDGRAAGLLFVSPTQINFYVDASAAVGRAVVTVAANGESGSVFGEIAGVSPGIFTLPCLRTDRGAALNGVTHALEPFRALTGQNPGDDKATRLSLFASGIRHAHGSVSVEATDRTGRVVELPVEYAGPAPVFFGLDQINVVLLSSHEGAGLVRLRILVDGEASNFVSILIGAAAPAGAAGGGAVVLDVAGDGLNQHAGDGLAALQASLRRPAGLVFDRLGALYIADPLAHAVRKVSADGTISTFAGSGDPGDDGDGGPAAAARLTSPVALAVSPKGDVYIADAAARRVRRVGPDGVIHAFAGTGADGDEGDGGQALPASFREPSGLAVNQYGSVYIADVQAHRVRKVLGDGSISAFAGSGSPGFAGDGGAARAASLNQPQSLTLGVDGSLLIADSGNFAIRSVSLDGTIRTVAGDGGSEEPAHGAFAQSSPAGTPLAIQADAAGRVCVADSEHDRIRVLDSGCFLWNIAGVGAAGFSPAGTPAEETWMNNPSGVAVDAAGIVHFSDADNHKVRKLDRAAGAAGSGCEQTVSVSVTPAVVMSGESAAGVVDLGCAADAETTVLLSADDPRLLVPASLTVSAGLRLAFFVVESPAVDEVTTIEIRATASGIEGSTRVTVVPAGEEGPKGITLSASSVVGGNPVEALLTLGAPAPAGGLSVQLTMDRPEAQAPPSVTVPQGLLGVEFLIQTDPVAAEIVAEVRGTSGEAEARASFTILPTEGGDGGSGGPVEAALRRLELNPSTVVGGEPSVGTVELAEPAPNGGVRVRLEPTNANASTPASLVIPSGEISASFPVSTREVEEDRRVGIRATSANTVDASLSVLAANGGGTEPRLIGLSLNPSAVQGGDPSTGAVSIDGPAPAGGLSVELSSSRQEASTPTSVTIPEGATSATFTVDSSAVASVVVAAISASASNTVSADLTIEPAPAPTAQITSLSLNPETVVGGESSTATVVISSAAPAGGVKIDIQSDNPSATAPSSVTVAAGSTQASFTVSTVSVGSPTAAQITATSANSASATLTILPKPCVVDIEVSVSSILGGNPLSGIVTLTAAAGPGGVDVELDSSIASVSVPATVHVSEGQTSASFSITTNPVASLVGAVITATLDGCSGVQVTVSVNPPCVADLQLSVSTALGGDSLTGTVELTGPAPAGGSQVTLVSSSSAASVPSKVTVPAGQTSASFTISTAPVPAILGAVVEALLGDCPGVSANLTLEAPVLQSLGISPSTIPLAGSATATVTLSGPAPAGGVTVNLQGSSDNVVVGLLTGVLSIVTPSSVTVDAGETEASFSVSAALTGLLGLVGNQSGEVVATAGGVVKTAGIVVTP